MDYSCQVNNSKLK